MQLPLRSYDTNFHIFFASHYVHHWFDPWNVKWFAGFSQTTYPPLTQQWVAVLSWILGLNFAYMAVQLAGILLLVIGIYRFALLWVSPRAASYAAIASFLIGSEGFLVYSAGQLATTCSAPIYLNALPFLYAWLRHGRMRSFWSAVALFVAAAAAHHVTLLFGSFFFAVPVVILAWMDARRDEDAGGTPAMVRRLITIVLLVGAAIAVVLLPYWIGLIRYPVTQTPIPHASRANYLLSPEWGMNYFIVPYGAMILALPFLIWRGSVVPRLRPLMLGFWVAFMLGLGGTTPLGPILLGRAFNVLTMERFSYWATLLALPILGSLAAGLIARFNRRAAVPLAILGALTCALGASWSTFHPADPIDFNVTPVSDWLNRDGHYQYRYITLGFGNKLSRLAIDTRADSVDGGSNSSRMLPELTQYGGGELTSAKYFGEGGLESLRVMLSHADRYGLKWVIVADPYYDPLLAFAGWRRVDSLDDGTLTVWGKDGIAPATPRLNAGQPPAWQGLMWGTLPFGSSLVAIAILLLPGRKEDEDTGVETPAMGTEVAL
jgi:hypothetical protein